MFGHHLKKEKRKVIITNCVNNINIESTYISFLSRHTRWLKMRASINKLGFFGEFVGNPIVTAFFLLLINPNQVMLLALLTVAFFKTCIDISIINYIRNETFPARYYLAILVKDISIALILPYAAFSRTITWRGSKVRISKNSQITFLQDK